MGARISSILRALPEFLLCRIPGAFSPELRATRRLLLQRLHQAFRLASIQQRAVRIPPSPERGEDPLALRLPPGVRWGRPEAVPPPPDLVDSGWSSAPPRALTILPRRRAATNVWFLHHGHRALCLRLGLTGEVEFLGYHPLLGVWRKA